MTSKLFWADVTLPKNYTSQSILTGREGGGGVMKIKNMRLEYMRKKEVKKAMLEFTVRLIVNIL